MTTYYAKETYANATGESEFSIPFEYYEQSHISVTLNGVAQTNGVDYTINESTQKVVFGGGTTAGYAVVIYRTTPIATDELVVTFSDASGFNASDLNDSVKQTIFAVQEMDDDLTDGIADINTAVTTVEGYDSRVDALEALAGFESQVLPVTRGGTGSSTAADARTALSLYSSSEVDSAIDADIAALSLGTISTQAANNIAITGGSITGITDLAIADGGTGASTATEGFDNLAPTTTKGDIIVSNGSDNIRLAVGTNDYVLTADSAEASGLKWSSAATSVGEGLFRAYANTGGADQTLSAATATVVQFGAESYDLDSAFASHTFTVPSTGYYCFNYSVLLILTATTRLLSTLWKNDSSIFSNLSYHLIYDATGNRKYQTVRGSTIAYLAQNDTIQLKMQPDAAAVDVDQGTSYSYWEGFRVR